jgi:hypothetical protein
METAYKEFFANKKRNTGTGNGRNNLAAQGIEDEGRNQGTSAPIPTAPPAPPVASSNLSMLKRLVKFSDK